MKTFAVVCLVLGCSLPAYSTYVTRHGGNLQTCCRDYIGRRVRPGQSYYDGCNTCICGQNGFPSICTQRYCGPNDMNTGNPRYGVNPVLPTIPVNRVRPVIPNIPVNRAPPAIPTIPGNGVLPVIPLNPTYNINPTASVAPKYVPFQMRRY